MDFSQILALFGGGSGGGGFDFTKLLGGGKGGGAPMQGGQGSGGVSLPFGLTLKGNPQGQQIPQAQAPQQSPLQGVNWGNVDMSALMQMAQQRRKIGL